MLKTNDKKKILNLSSKNKIHWHITYRAIKKRITADSSSETMEAKCIRRKNKTKHCIPTALSQGKIPFKNND